jgi:hypothetical protein
VPAIAPGGVVPAASTVAAIQNGEWVSIFGSSLATSIANWTGDFPTSLAGTSQGKSRERGSPRLSIGDN